jgi:hypothetical protein
MTTRRLAAALALLACAACSGNDTPSSPTAPPTTSTLQSVTLSGSSSGWKARGAQIPTTATGHYSNGTTQNVTTTCTNWGNDNPGVLSINQAGVMTALGDGVSAIWTTCQSVYATGHVTLMVIPDQPFVQSGFGNSVFTMPTYVSRVRIRGVWNGTGNSNFIVRVGGSLEVNEILRDMPNRTYEGTHLVSGGTVEITNSSGITWTFTELR